MTKFNLLFSTCCFFFLMALIFIQKSAEKPILGHKLDLSNCDEIKNDSKESDLIKALNQKRETVRNIKIDDIKIIWKQNALPIRLTGNLIYEKPKKLSFQVFHRITGKEIDIGSNEEYFWFYCKRMKPENFYYGKHSDDIYLRSALHPDWIIESLDLKPWNIDAIKICSINNYFALKEKRTISNGCQIEIVSLLDKDKKRMLGKYLYDEAQNLLISTEYTDFNQEEYPTKIHIHWHEENIQMTWILTKITKNLQLDSQNWKLPSLKNAKSLSQ